MESSLRTAALPEPPESLWTTSLKDSFSFDVNAGLQGISSLWEHTRRHTGIFKQHIEGFHQFYISSCVFTTSFRKTDINYLLIGTRGFWFFFFFLVKLEHLRNYTSFVSLYWIITQVNLKEIMARKFLKYIYLFK